MATSTGSPLRRNPAISADPYSSNYTPGLVNSNNNLTPTRNPGISNDPNSGNYNPNISKNLFGSDKQSDDNQSAGKRRRKSKKGGKWSRKYKRSINCRRPKGFSQRQHCKYGRRSRRR